MSSLAAVYDLPRKSRFFEPGVSPEFGRCEFLIFRIDSPLVFSFVAVVTQRHELNFSTVKAFVCEFGKAFQRLDMMHQNRLCIPLVLPAPVTFAVILFDDRT